MLLEILMDAVLWVLSLFSFIFPYIAVPPEFISAMDNVMSFVVQGAGVLKFIFGPAVTWLANLGISLIGLRLILNVVYFIFRWLPFLDMGGD